MNDSTKLTRLAFWRTQNGKTALIVLAIVVFYPFIHAYLVKQSNLGPAPLFEATFINGESFKLNDFSGKPLLIHFWATWCEICRHEMPDIEKLAQSHQVINIAIQSGSNAQVNAFAKANGMTLDIIVNDQNKQIETLYNAQGVPASFVLNSQGDIVYTKRGYSTFNDLNNQLTALTQESSSSKKE